MVRISVTSQQTTTRHGQSHDDERSERKRRRRRRHQETEEEEDTLQRVGSLLFLSRRVKGNFDQSCSRRQRLTQPNDIKIELNMLGVLYVATCNELKKKVVLNLTQFEIECGTEKERPKFAASNCVVH